jgi:hypothetical protein
VKLTCWCIVNSVRNINMINNIITHITIVFYLVFKRGNVWNSLKRIRIPLFLAILYERVLKDPISTSGFQLVDWHKIDEELFLTNGKNIKEIGYKKSKIASTSSIFWVVKLYWLTYCSSSNQVFSIKDVWKIFKIVMNILFYFILFSKPW